jgi:hypothetical protein
MGQADRRGRDQKRINEMRRPKAISVKSWIASSLTLLAMTLKQVALPSLRAKRSNP